MSNRITYLIGAGASCDALPMVNQIENQLDDFKKELNIHNPPSTVASNLGTSYNEKYGKYKIDNLLKSPLKKDILTQFIQSIEWLKKACAEHYSIDTYAKKLFLKQEDEKLQELKITLSCFFTFLQNTQLDNRYDSFLASVIEDLKNLPANIKILSWNYDYQLEIAMSQILEETNFTSAKKYIKIVKKGDQITEKNLINDFCLFKINGSTELQKNNEINLICKNVNSNKVELLDNILLNYYKVKSGNARSKLSFAWESEGLDAFNESLSFSISNTQVLVVIGYSFPFFNRMVDLQILKSMPRLRKIYIQDPKNADGIEEKIKSLYGNMIVGKSIKYQKIIDIKDQFYLPFEL